MYKDIDTIDPRSGRILKEDNSVVNMADTIAGATDPLGGITVSDEEQHAIHSGTAYSYSTHGTITAGASLTLLGRLSTKQAHFDGMNINMQTGGMLVEFIEAPTVTVLGTAQTARRKNRVSTNAVTMLLYSGSTITGGTILFDTLPPIVSGQGNKIESSTSGIVKGWVLKQNTDYAIKITNTNGTSATFDANFGWHEPDTLLGA